MFFFNDTATTEIYTLSLHDALPILPENRGLGAALNVGLDRTEAELVAYLPSDDVYHAFHLAELVALLDDRPDAVLRSEEHTSELQSRQYLVCRLLLEKKTQIARRCY